MIETIYHTSGPVNFSQGALDQMSTGNETQKQVERRLSWGATDSSPVPPNYVEIRSSVPPKQIGRVATMSLPCAGCEFKEDIGCSGVIWKGEIITVAPIGQLAVCGASHKRVLSEIATE